jgi:hypothetical protein
MRDSFEAVMTALWASLGLGQSARIDPDATSLRIDGLTVHLSPTPGGDTVLVRAAVGRLDPDRHRSAAQMQDLLRTALGLILTNRAALRLGAAPGQVVEVQALGPCRIAAVPDLRALIEDVLFQVDLHGPSLEVRRGPPAQAPGWPGEMDPDSLIFRA